MNSLLDTVEFLVAVGSDAGNQEPVQPDSLLDSEGWLRQEDAAQMWESLDVDVSYLAPGIRALLRDAGTEAKLGICLLYFRMLNSAGCPVRHIDCFTLHQRRMVGQFELQVSVGAGARRV